MKRNRFAHRTDCEGFHRRDFLKAGALGLFGLGMADFLRLKAFASRADGKEGAAKSVILIWMGGGPSHLDLWDLKPGCTAGSSRVSQSHRHKCPRNSDLRTSASNRQADGQNLRHSINDVDRSRSRARDSLLDDGIPAATRICCSELRLCCCKTEGIAFGATALYCDPDSVRVFRRGVSWGGTRPVLGRRRSVAG